jgi:ATP-dependent DNA helicase RecG
MSQTDDAIAIQIEKILRLEAARGYQDDAVTCGLEAFIEKNLPDARGLVSGYAEGDRAQRRHVVRRLSERLSGGPEQVASPEDLTRPVRFAKGVGEKRARRLLQLGIRTIEDLLTYLPRRLEDRSRFLHIGDLRRGEEGSVRGTVATIDQIRTGRRMTIMRAVIGDGTGFLTAVWFNQPWLRNQIHPRDQIDLYGKVERRYGQFQMPSPVWEPAGDGLAVGRLVPIYPATEGMSDRFLRSIIARNFEVYGAALCDVLPRGLRRRHGLLRRRDAVRAAHFPQDEADYERARRSLAFEELFLLQLGLARTTHDSEGRARTGSGRLVGSFLSGLAFRLTPAQRRAVREILADLRAPRRMMRLLQGDVGSGKTIVALIAALVAIEAGEQVAVMVPTEILAQQHADRIERLFSGLPVRVGLLIGAERDKASLKDDLREGRIDLLVGTHAVIQEDVAFARLGLVVIDEQHRFGVVQRSKIEEKGELVDLLVMSATPIPRTIALTLYGEFDVSLIDEMPFGDKQTQTLWVGETRRAEVYDEVRRLLAQGEKGYVVLPLVEESEKLDMKAAVGVAEELSAAFPDHGVGLIHGRLGAAEKAAVMTAFQDGTTRLLVSTTVIEVGIDVPDASFMVIEHAERFGLSQLHQLRGRIGRTGQVARCFAIARASTEEAQQRLAAFAKHADGFSIAEEDLLIRGPGDLLGTRQHGFLTGLHAVDLVRDVDLMGTARREARRFAAHRVPTALSDEVSRRFGDVLQFLYV